MSGSLHCRDHGIPEACRLHSGINVLKLVSNIKNLGELLSNLSVGFSRSIQEIRQNWVPWVSTCLPPPWALWAWRVPLPAGDQTCHRAVSRQQGHRAGTCPHYQITTQDVGSSLGGWGEELGPRCMGEQLRGRDWASGSLLTPAVICPGNKPHWLLRSNCGPSGFSFHGREEGLVPRTNSPKRWYWSDSGFVFNSRQVL